MRKSLNKPPKVVAKPKTENMEKNFDKNPPTYRVQWRLHKGVHELSPESRENKPVILKELEVNITSIHTHSWYFRYITACFQAMHPKQAVERHQYELSVQPTDYYLRAIRSGKAQVTKINNAMRQHIEWSKKQLFFEPEKDPNWKKAQDKLERKVVELFQLRMANPLIYNKLEKERLCQ